MNDRERESIYDTCAAILETFGYVCQTIPTYAGYVPVIGRIGKNHVALCRGERTRMIVSLLLSDPNYQLTIEYDDPDGITKLRDFLHERWQMLGVERLDPEQFSLSLETLDAKHLGLRP